MPSGFLLFLIPLVFFAVALTILYGFQYCIYFSVTRLFEVRDQRGRRAIMALLSLVIVGVVVSMGLQRNIEEGWSRIIAGAFLLAIACCLNLSLAFLLGWVGWALARLWAPRPGKPVFGWAAVVLALGWSAYGVWNAGQLRVEHVTVRMKDLPAQWRGRSIAQISDAHLGFSAGREFAERVVRLVNAEHPTAVAITGDLFDGGEAGLDGLAGILNGLDAPLGTYFVAGNHENYVGLERVKQALAHTRVRVLEDEMALADGLQIVGIAFPRSGNTRDVGAAVRQVRGFDPALASVLLYHSPTGIADVKAAGIRLELCGHTHRGQLIPFQFITRLLYGKYDHGLNVEDGFAIYTSTGAFGWGPRMRTSGHPEIALIRLESQ